MRFAGPTDKSVLAHASTRNPDEPPELREDFVSAMMTILGYLLLACLFANVAQSLQIRNDSKRRRAQGVAQKKEEMSAAGIPKELEEKVLATYEHIYRFGGAGTRDSMVQDKTLSLDLRRELALFMYGDALRKVPMFTTVSDSTLKCIAQQVELHLYTPGDLMMMCGEVGTELFIIQKGSVQPLDYVPSCGTLLWSEGAALFGE